MAQIQSKNGLKKILGLKKKTKLFECKEHTITAIDEIAFKRVR